MSTLAYFPEVLPGELLYSVLARYHRHMGAPCSTRTMQSLFGRRLAIASPDLPGGLPALASRLPASAGITVDRMITTMTLLPYYSAFQPPAAREHALALLRVGETDGLLMSLGMAAFRIGRVTRLRFCCSCLEATLAQHGECYWRGIHQLPSVFVCPFHDEVLRLSTVDVTRLPRHEFALANRTTCPWNAPVLVRRVNSTGMCVLSSIARASASLLTDPGPARTFEEWTSWYRQRMYLAGLAASTKRMNLAQLESRMHSHLAGCGNAFVSIVQKGRFAGDWLASLVRKHRKASHPLYHLVLQDLLRCAGTREFPFGHGPWACLNPLAGHRGRHVITDVQQHRNHGHAVGVFACRCGYVYTRSLQEPSGQPGDPRFLQYGPRLRPALLDLIEAGCSLREVGRRLELDPKTVVRLSRLEGLVTPWAVAPAKPVPAVAHKVVRAVSTAAVSDARTKPCPVQRPPRRDWVAVDAASCDRIKAVAAELRSRIPPVRVTITEIERQLSGRGWFAKRRHKLPTALACLSAEAESLAAFRQRRVDSVLEEMTNLGQPLAPWRVLRRAGLTAAHVGLIRERIAVGSRRAQEAA